MRTAKKSLQLVVVDLVGHSHGLACELAAEVAERAAEATLRDDGVGFTEWLTNYTDATETVVIEGEVDPRLVADALGPDDDGFRIEKPDGDE